MCRSDDQCSKRPNTPPEGPSEESSPSSTSQPAEAGCPAERPSGPFHPSDRASRRRPLAGSGPSDRSSPSNAFSQEFLDRLRRSYDHPPTPEAANAGPFRVEWIGSTEGSDPAADPTDPSSPPSSHPDLPWACFSAGEAAPRACLADPDVAFLTAAALPLTGQAPRFSLVEDLDAEEDLYLLASGCGDRHGEPYCEWGSVRGWTEDLPWVLTVLDLLRVRPLTLAHYLLSVGDETLRRAGAILAELAGDSGEVGS